MKQGIFFEPGEGIALSARGSSIVFKAVAGTTSGAFSLMERELPASNRRPPAHRHQGPEGFYVLAGSIEFVVGGERHSLRHPQAGTLNSIAEMGMSGNMFFNSVRIADDFQLR